MGYSINHLSGEPVLIATFTEPFDAVSDGGAVAGSLINALNNRTETLYYIADMSGLQISFSDLVSGLAAAFATPGSPYTHPLIKIFTVATDELIGLGAKAAAEQQQYGKASVKFYPNVEEALKEIHMMVAKG